MRVPTLPAVRCSRRVATAAAGVVLIPVVAFGGYLAMQRSGAFAVRTVDVSGAPAPLAASVRETALGEVDGRSMLAVSPGALAHALEQLPRIQSATVDRDFPSTLRIHVVPEQPAAVAVADGSLAVVSSAGRVLETTDRAHLPRLPHLLFTGRLPAPGATLTSAAALDDLRVVVALPERFGGRVVSVRTDDHGSVVARLEMGVDIRLGPAHDAQAKLRVASLVLGQYPRAARANLRYLDVSAPEHPVVCPKGGDTTTLPSSSGGSGSGSAASDTTIPSPTGVAGCVVPTATGQSSSSATTTTTASTTTTTSTTQ